MKMFLFVAMTILTYFGKVCSLQCYVPGECNFSPVIDVIIQPDQNELAHWFKYVYGTPKKVMAAWPRLKLHNFNISIL